MENEGLDLSLPIAGPELFIGLVGAVGADMKSVYDCLSNNLQALNYTCENIKVSDLISLYTSGIDESNLYDRYRTLMKNGTEMRQQLNRADGLALAAVSKMWGVRAVKTPKSKRINSKKSNEPPDPVPYAAYIFDQLKNPAEVRILRWIFGKSFYLIGAYCSQEDRTSSLSAKIAASKKQFKDKTHIDLACELISTDYVESGKKPFGQNISKTFPEADVFINTSDKNGMQMEIQRFTQLIFSNPSLTPTKDEFGMFHAKSAALRSSDLARQIGASIMSGEGDLLCVGCNDAAKAGGGQYWVGDENDHRDINKSYDTNDFMKKQMLVSVLERLKTLDWIKKTDDEIQQLITNTFKEKPDSLSGVKVMDVIEFFRSVHAEMAALMTAARLGISVKDAILYTTAFPCHECARHIVAAGIKRVVYIEPYPKSLAADLFEDSITVDKKTCDGKVNFEPFVGVAPRQYMTLFDMGELQRKDDLGEVQSWNTEKARLKVFELERTHIVKEAYYVHLIKPLLKKLQAEKEEREGHGEQIRKNQRGARSSKPSSAKYARLDEAPRRQKKGGSKTRSAKPKQS